MAELDFGSTEEQKMATLIAVVRGLHRDFYGNGQPGLKKAAEDFMQNAIGAREEQERQHKQNRWRLDLIIGILTVAALWLAIFHH